MSSCVHHPNSPGTELCKACSAALCQDCVARNNGFCNIDCYEALKGSVGYQPNAGVEAKREAMERVVARTKLAFQIGIGLVIVFCIYLGLRYGYATRWHPYARVLWQLAPEAAGPTYILTADENRLVARVGGAIVAVLPESGEEIWRLAVEEEFTTMDIEKDGFFFANSKQAIRLNGDGKELWRVEMGGNRRYIGSSKDVLLFWEVGEYKRKVLIYDWKARQKLQQRNEEPEPPGPWEPLLANDDLKKKNRRLLDARWESRSRDHFLIGVNRNTGMDLWAAPLDGDMELSRVAIGGQLGIMGITRWTDETTVTRHVVAFNPRDGTRLWSKRFNKSFSGPGFDEDGNVLIHFTYESKLYDPKGQELAAPKRDVEIQLEDDIQLVSLSEDDPDYRGVVPFRRIEQGQLADDDGQIVLEHEDSDDDADGSRLGDDAVDRWEEPAYVFNDYTEQEDASLVITRDHKLNLLTPDRRGVMWSYGLGGGVTNFAEGESVVVITGHSSEEGMQANAIARGANRLAGGDAALAGYIASIAVTNDWILAALDRESGKELWRKEGVTGRIFPHHDSFVLLEDTLDVSATARARNEAGITVLSQYQLKDGTRIFRRSLEDMALRYPRILAGNLIGIAGPRTGRMNFEYGNFFELLNADGPQATGIVAITLK